MRKLQFLLIALMVSVGSLAAQEPTPTRVQGYLRTIEFHFEERAIVVPLFGQRVEAIPIFELIEAEAKYSLSAGTFGVVYEGHVIQFAIDHKVLLVDGTLQEAKETPVASPDGVAVSLGYLERYLLSPLGFHLEPIPRGYRIERGARFASPVTVRPAAADFAVTTTLVLTLNRVEDVEVVETEAGRVVVNFDNASPQLDSSMPFRSRRVRSLTSVDQTVEIELARGVGLLSWHTLEGPPRVTMELGPARPTPTPEPVRAPVVRQTGPRPIVIDPGHGGDDIGAQSRNGLSEKELTLAVARRLARVLEGRGYAVRLTRDSDQSRALLDRTALANRLEAPVFVSLHANASTFSSVSGAETYFMSLDRATDEAAAATADLENRPTTASEDRSPLDLILWDLAQAEVLNESADLALAVQGRLNARLGLRDRGVKQAPFVVLTGATMPAILVEVGFLSNPEEEKKLDQPDHQQELAEAIADGVLDFVRRR
jgi:N-acetylmuramoyl-L-alanine amidase